MEIPKTFTLLYFISLYFTIKLKRKFNILNETPTLVYRNSKNKRARAVFLFDSSRANKILLVSNKKSTSSLIFNGVLGRQKREKNHFLTEKRIFLLRNAYFGISKL